MTDSLTVRRRLAASLRLFAEMDFDEGAAGHLTARDPVDPHRFWINPLGHPFDQMRASDLSCVTLDGELVSGDPPDGGGVALHAAVYRRRPDLGSVLHAHPVHLKAWSTLGRLLDPINQEACIFYGVHALFDEYNGTFARAAEESERVAELFADPVDNVAVILRNHAGVAVGETVDAATYRFVMFDRCARVQLLAEAAGSPVCIDHDVAVALAAEREHSHRSFEPMYRSVVGRHPDLLD
ncbi:MAG: class II aldolase/adducin family protein [Acidimicrobiales bacterium]